MLFNIDCFLSDAIPSLVISATSHHLCINYLSRFSACIVCLTSYTVPIGTWWDRITTRLTRYADNVYVTWHKPYINCLRLDMVSILLVSYGSCIIYKANFYINYPTSYNSVLST